MRANYKMQRLHVPHDLAQGCQVEPGPQQMHYLANVLRFKQGSQLLVFNGRDGEWLAEVASLSRNRLTLTVLSQTRPQPPDPDLLYCFAPIKQGRLDYLVQKAVEMGAGRIQPVITRHTQMQTIGIARLRANAVEAAEQCGILAIPQLEEPVKLEILLQQWDPARRLIFCDEGADTDNPVPILSAITETRLGLLTGPEGGFSQQERQLLHATPFVTAIPLGPRILRADTAGVAALAVIQAIIGDWSAPR